MNQQGILVTRGREIRIPRSGAVVLGRGKNADVMLRDERISRAHAAVAQKDDGYYLTDLGSFNGTYLNGKRIGEPVKLHPTDEIRIYPFSFVFLMIGVPEVSSGNADSPFSGDLNAVPLSDLIQMLRSGQRTGLLTMYGSEDTDPARLSFVDGEVVHVVQGRYVNEDAFLRLFSIRSGRFKFEPCEIPEPDSRIGTDTMTLLLRACQQRDEKGELPDVVDGQDVSEDEPESKVASKITGAISTPPSESPVVTPPASSNAREPQKKTLFIKKPRSIKLPPRV